ncbi:MAG TPA: sulfotransferase [Candidatus Limnocylindrales bacterium]|nr:sulfotransferase [Candidatus Limnocylindrales bacterium]
MSLRVVGAGLGRTGTMSLKLALEQLLGGPCYHMAEVIEHPEHIPVWHQAALGKLPDWRRLFEGYRAAVDWPVAAFWEPIAAAFPDAIIVHSNRDPESWWESASSTIFPTAAAAQGPWREMLDAMFGRHFTTDLGNREECISAYKRHNAHVLATADPKRLVEWTAKQGWAPLCRALNLPVPDAEFPRVNTKEEFHHNFPPPQNA